MVAPRVLRGVNGKSERRSGLGAGSSRRSGGVGPEPQYAGVGGTGSGRNGDIDGGGGWQQIDVYFGQRMLGELARLDGGRWR